MNVALTANSEQTGRMHGEEESIISPHSPQRDPPPPPYGNINTRPPAQRAGVFTFLPFPWGFPSIVPGQHLP
jgi:hypothetical protein